MERLLQETYGRTGWNVLVICILLNKTKGSQVEPILKKLFDKYPSAYSIIEADPTELYEMVKSLGFGHRRTRDLIEMSCSYALAVTNALEKNPSGLKDVYKSIRVRMLRGCGKYAEDSWRMFILGDLSFEPDDKVLKGVVKSC